VQISLEELIARDPDLILLGDALWGGVTVESVKARAGWEGLTAVQDEQIFPSMTTWSAGPAPGWWTAWRGLARLLHPDLFD